MSDAVLQACCKLRLAPTPKCVLMFLAHESDDAGLCTVTVAAVCEWTCFGRTAVIAALGALEDAQLIVLTKAAGRPHRCQIDLERVADPSASRTGTRPPAERVEETPVRQPNGFAVTNPSASRMGVPLDTGTDPSASRTGECALTGTPGERVEADPSASRTGTRSPAEWVGPNPSASRTGSPQLSAIGSTCISLSIQEEKKKTNTSCPELELTAQDPEPAAVAQIPLVDGSEYPITQAYVDELAEAYPGVDITLQLKRARIWCNDNPKLRKTKSGVRRFITGWMGRAQNDSAKTRATGQRVARTPSRHTGFDTTVYEGAPDGSVPIPE